MSRILILMSVVLMVVTRIIAGDDQSYYMTGNRSVDFWGPPKSMHSLERNNPSKYMFQEIGDQSGNEKSPALAGLMSLVLPGAGEFYSEQYVRGAIFFSVEVASWVVYAVYTRKGDKQTEWFKAYANEHYSAARYAQWVIRNIGALAPNINDIGNYQIFFTGADSNGGPPFAALNWPELNRLEGNISDFTHRLPYYDVQQYYELIGKYRQFSKGWDSQVDKLSDPEFESGNDQFYYYGVEFNKADHYYSIAEAFLAVAIGNHLLSALDAIWSASDYNKTLHAQASMDMRATPFGYEPEARFDLQITF